VLGVIGIDSTSLAQLKWVGTGIECGGAELDRAATGDGDSKIVAVGGSDVPAAVEDAGGGKTAHLWSSWGELGQMGGEQCVEDEWGASAGADGIVGDAGGVYLMDGVKTAHLRGLGGSGWFGCVPGVFWWLRWGVPSL
jgi:hypothetical protein